MINSDAIYLVVLVKRTWGELANVLIYSGNDRTRCDSRDKLV